MLTAEQRERVRAVYAVADAAVAAAGPRCDASGRCCRFAEYGHTLFISQLEADVLLAGAPPLPSPPSAPGRVGSVASTADWCSISAAAPCSAW